MQNLLSRFVPEKDPHKGRCGDCHNPHTQKRPNEAFKSCTNGACHARADTLTPFHRGLHALANCGACHEAHTWKVKGKQCLDCHRDIFKSASGDALPRLERLIADRRTDVVR
jgi:hypothetical protein